jgi:hypothetical protein
MHSGSELNTHHTDIPGVLNSRRGAGSLGDAWPGAEPLTTDRPRQPDPLRMGRFADIGRLASSWPRARFSSDYRRHRVMRPQTPTSAMDESLVVHRPGLVPLPKSHREPAVSALSSLFEDLLHRMAGSSHKLDLRPESRSHASDPGLEQGRLSPKHTEGACE